MPTYIAILRGINVNGKNLLKMEDLRLLFETLDYKAVKSYIQSGNVVFENKTSKCKDLERKISAQIRETFGFDVPVLVKEAFELREVYKQNPFLNKRKEDSLKLHVTFLSDLPKPEALEAIKTGNYGADEFIVIDKNIYLFCPDGYGNTKLSNTFFETKLKVKATTRNWNTITKLVAMSEGKKD